MKGKQKVSIMGKYNNDKKKMYTQMKKEMKKYDWHQN